MSSKRFNLRLQYAYRLTASHKIVCRLVLKGPVGSNDVAAIKDKLDEGRYFIPGQVLLPDLRCAFGSSDREWDPRIDQPWHELEKISLTVTKPSEESGDAIGIEAESVVAAFVAAVWDDRLVPSTPKAVFTLPGRSPASEPASVIRGL